jgi:outer membrane protein assembly factor BamB
MFTPHSPSRSLREGRAALIVIIAGITSGILPMVAKASDAGWPSIDLHHILIADQFNNRVIEVDRFTHKVVWQFGDGSDKPGPHSVVGVNDAERVGTYTLISGTGTPPNDPPLPGCSDPINGCSDNRVFLVDMHGQIVWQYGQAGVSGAGFNQLNTPVQASFLPQFRGHHGFQVLIADQANQRVIVVDRAHHLIWQYGTTGVAGNGANQLSSPNSVQLLANGSMLIADENNNRVIEVTADGQLAKQFTASGTLGATAFASRLPNGNTLISDAGNNRIVEVDSGDAVVWAYATNLQSGSNPNPAPTRAVRLRNGHTLISDQFNNRVMEVTRDKHIVFQQGRLNVGGNGFNQLNGPYDAKVIGDFTGLTPAGEINLTGD